MKYIAVLDTDDFEDFEFFEDGCGKYIHGIDAGSVNGEWIALYFTECKQESVLDKIKEEIKDNTYFINETTEKEGIDFETVEKIIDKYMEKSDIEKHKPCINYEDGCEEWAGCPCVHYKAESEG